MSKRAVRAELFVPGRRALGMQGLSLAVLAVAFAAGATVAEPVPIGLFLWALGGFFGLAAAVSGWQWRAQGAVHGLVIDAAHPDDVPGLDARPVGVVGDLVAAPGRTHVLQVTAGGGRLAPDPLAGRRAAMPVLLWLAGFVAVLFAVLLTLRPLDDLVAPASPEHRGAGSLLLHVVAGSFALVVTAVAAGLILWGALAPLRHRRTFRWDAELAALEAPAGSIEIAREQLCAVQLSAVRDALPTARGARAIQHTVELAVCWRDGGGACHRAALLRAPPGSRGAIDAAVVLAAALDLPLDVRVSEADWRRAGSGRRPVRT